MNHVDTVATPYMATVRATFTPKNGIGESPVFFMLPVKPGEAAIIDSMAAEFQDRLAEALEINAMFGEHSDFKPGDHTVSWAFVEQLGFDGQGEFVTSGGIRPLWGNNSEHSPQ